jgi:dihydroorotase
VHMTDLILRGGRVIDPASGRDETADIAFGDGKVTEIGSDLPASGTEIIDMRGLLAVPGLIDLHTHLYWGGTSLGVEAVEVARQSGTTTFVDAGSAGPGTFPGFRRHVIEPSPLRIEWAAPLRNRWFADSPLEGSGFELLVPVK